MRIGIGCVFGSLLAPLILLPKSHSIPSGIACLVVLGIVVGFGCAFVGITRSHQWSVDLRNAVETANIEYIGAIVEVMGDRARFENFAFKLEDQAVRRHFYRNIEDVLLRLLLLLQAGDLSLFTHEQLAILHRGLQSRDSYFVETLLTALVRIDDQSSVPAITALANGQWKAEQDGNLRATAQRCLEQLQANREREQMPQVLLRASASSDVASDTLLHAVAAPQQTPEQLLRASRE